MVPMLRPRNRRRARMVDISLTPLIDTALTLLIIFMVATPMLHNSIRVTLPRGAVNEAGSAKQELVVEVDKSGSFFLRGVRMSTSDIIAELKKLIGARTNAVVFVKGDKESRYGVVMEFIDHVKMISGVEHVALATEKRK